MDSRSVALGATFVFICLLGVLTISGAVKHGVDILVIVSLVILAMIGFGVFGALTNSSRAGELAHGGTKAPPGGAGAPFPGPGRGPRGCRCERLFRARPPPRSE